IYLNFNHVFYDILGIDPFETPQVLFDTLAAACICFDTELTVITSNSAAYEVFGFASKDELAKRFFERFQAVQPCGTPTLELFQKKFGKAMRGEKAVFELCRREPGAEHMYFELSLRRVVSAHTEVVLCEARDVSHHKRRVISRSEMYDIMSTMVEFMPLAADFWDKDLQLLGCNEEAFRRYGLGNKQEYVGEFAMISPKIQPGGRLSSELMREYIARGFKDGFVRFNWTYQDAYGAQIPSEVWVVRCQIGGEYACFTYAMDMRELYESQVREQETAERMLTILENTPLLIEYWDSEFNCIYVNKAGVDLFGRSDLSEYLAKFIEILPEYQPCGTPSWEFWTSNLKIALKSGFCRFELVCEKPGSGEVMPFDMTAISVHVQGRPVIVTYGRDLREQRALMEKEREANKRVQLMFESAPIIIEYWDKDLNQTDINREGLNILGLRDKWEHRDRAAEISPKHQPSGELSQDVWDGQLRKALEDGSATFEYLCRKPHSGESLPLQVHAVRMTIQGEHMIVTYARDIRELRKATSKMKDASSRMTAMFETTPLAICFWDETFNLIDCNQACVKMTGAADKKAYLERFFDVSPKVQPCGTASGAKILRFLSIALTEGLAKFEWVFKTPAGDAVPCDITLARIDHSEGSILVAYMQDMRELKGSLERERETDARVQLVFDATPLLVEYFDKDLKCVFTNQTGIEIYDLTSKEEYYRVFRDLMPKEQPCGTPSMQFWSQKMKDAMRSGYAQYEFVCQKLDGERIPFEVTAMRMDYHGEPMVVTYSRDVRELKRAMSQMQAANKRARLMFESTPLGILFFDEELNNVDCNDECLRMFEMPSKQAYTSGGVQRVMPEYQPCG
ncbi:MAG: PAS domain-containing protein, partial [Defluviitaleaceae bacterium]|nr:PAS domain-containing protein [Defluviitaleaceae bacterium]